MSSTMESFHPPCRSCLYFAECWERGRIGQDSIACIFTPSDYAVSDATLRYHGWLKIHGGICGACGEHGVIVDTPDGEIDTPDGRMVAVREHLLYIVGEFAYCDQCEPEGAHQ